MHIINLMTLRQWLTDNKRTQVWLAERLGVTQPRISQIVQYGTDSAMVCVAIEHLTNGEVSIKELLMEKAL